MNTKFTEILLGVKRSIGLLSQKAKTSLAIATFIMLITGIPNNATAKNACILDEIRQSLGSFNGLGSENGNNLSGGQRQRLALARVMLQTEKKQTR